MNLGKKHSFETKKKISNTKREVKVHTIESKKRISKASRKRQSTPEGKYWLGKKGKGTAHWKGGITPVMIQIRYCFEYRQWRSDIFTRDDFTCQFCNEKGGNLEADHYPKLFSEIIYEYNIKSLKEAISCEELWNINNGRTLCRDCHRKYGRKASKGKLLPYKV